MLTSAHGSVEDLVAIRGAAVTAPSKAAAATRKYMMAVWINRLYDEVVRDVDEQKS